MGCAAAAEDAVAAARAGAAPVYAALRRCGDLRLFAAICGSMRHADALALALGRGRRLRASTRESRVLIGFPALRLGALTRSLLPLLVLGREAFVRRRDLLKLCACLSWMAAGENTRSNLLGCCMCA
eukprot:6213868-Pleurochrysis_carterae.AAC.2